MDCLFPLGQEFGLGCSKLFRSAKLATTDPDPEVQVEIRHRPRKDRHCSHQFSDSSVEELQPAETMPGQGGMLFYRIYLPFRKQDISNSILNCELITRQICHPGELLNSYILEKVFLIYRHTCSFSYGGQFSIHKQQL
jgi:hypothetical protein